MTSNASKESEIIKLKKILNYLRKIDDNVEIELFTNERYEVEEYYLVTIGENYVGINRTGFYDSSYWSLNLDSQTFAKRINESIEKDDYNILIEDYMREEGDIINAKFINSGSGNYEIQDAVDDYDFDEIPENILDEETKEINIEKFQDLYGSDYELRDKEYYCGNIYSFSINLDKEKIEINVHHLMRK